ncbi:Os09g0384601, partial [Oryza sativa Japonica Group]
MPYLYASTAASQWPSASRCLADTLRAALCLFIGTPRRRGLNWIHQADENWIWNRTDSWCIHVFGYDALIGQARCVSVSDT